MNVGTKHKDAGGAKGLQRMDVTGKSIIKTAIHIIQETKEFQGGGNGPFVE